MTIFPSLLPSEAVRLSTLPMAHDVAWDFETDKPILQGGAPKLVSGLDAVRTWAWNALHTVRRRYPIWTRNYGNDMESLVGKPYTDELKSSEAARYVTECLLMSPYITGVRLTACSYAGDVLTVSATITTIYGEANVSV